MEPARYRRTTSGSGMATLPERGSAVRRARPGRREDSFRRGSMPAVHVPLDRFSLIRGPDVVILIIDHSWLSVIVEVLGLLSCGASFLGSGVVWRGAGCCTCWVYVASGLWL